MKKLSFLFCIFFLFGCKQNAPEPKQFQSYTQVSNYLDSADFKIDEFTNSEENSKWITLAHYQSLDGKTGYLTLGMRGKPYHFKNVPVELWENFKDSDTKGKFYHRYIKGNYSIHLKRN